MALYWICVIAFLGVIASGDDSCPTPTEIKPCTCDREGFNCMGARTSDEIKKAFQAKFKYGAIRSVYVVGTPITNIPANTFGNIKCQAFYIELNSIYTIDLKAFSASKKTLQTLSLFENQISDLNFGDFSIYEKLSVLNLASNQLVTIPDNAFNSKSLKTIYMNHNFISHIGKNAFNNLPSLSHIELSNNHLKTLGPMSFSFSSEVALSEIYLRSNSISDVSSSTFSGSIKKVDFSSNQLKSLKYKSFHALAEAVKQSGGTLHFGENHFTCKGCDYKWLVKDKANLDSILQDFSCRDGTKLKDLTYSKIGCGSY